MAGSLTHGELSASAIRGTGLLRFALATQKDEEAIRRLLRENPTRGTISLSFEREPNYFAGAGRAGAKDLTIVAYIGQHLVCLGHCATRNCWVGDEIKKVGYLGELRLDASVRGRADIVRRGYEFFRDLQQADPADVYFTSIASDNTPARRLLESGSRGFPSYDVISELVTLVIPVSAGTKRPARKNIRCLPATPDRVGEVIAFLNTPAARSTLATAWTPSQWLSLERHGLSWGDVHLCIKRINSLVAARSGINVASGRPLSEDIRLPLGGPGPCSISSRLSWAQRVYRRLDRNWRTDSSHRLRRRTEPLSYS